MLRKQGKFTQEEVAERLDVSRQAVAKWESGDSLPELDKCVALAKLYDVSLDDLVNGGEEETVPILPPKGKHVFGAVTLGERGQLVIPKKARDIFHFSPGDSLMILGDETLGGIAILKTELFLRSIEPLLDAVSRPMKGETNG